MTHPPTRGNPDWQVKCQPEDWHLKAVTTKGEITESSKQELKGRASTLCDTVLVNVPPAPYLHPSPQQVQDGCTPDLLV